MKRRDVLKTLGVGAVVSALPLVRGQAATMGGGIGERSLEVVLAAASTGDAKKTKQKIAVITGSPHRKGTSALLADRFIEGVGRSGHEVYRFDAAFQEVHPCIGCDRCGMNGPCIYKDAMGELLPKLQEADFVAFVTPLYYWGMSAQLKTVVDRFYSENGRLHARKRAALLATAYDSNDWTMQALTAHYKTLLRYMGWEDAGMVLAIGCGVRSDIERSEFPDRAYRLGLGV